MPTSSATSAAIPSTPRRWRSSTSSGCSAGFLERPYDRVTGAQIRVAGRDYVIGDLSHLRTPAPFIAMMPQWDFLDFLRDEAKAFRAFGLEMEAEVTGLVEENGRIAGVRLADGREMHAGKLVLMSDGRSSLVRKLGLCRLPSSARRWTCCGSACPRTTTPARSCAARSIPGAWRC